MNSTKNEQPAVCGWCMVGHHEEITRHNCKCPDCVAWRAAAAKLEGARAAEPEGFAVARGSASLPVVGLRKILARKIREARHSQRVCEQIFPGERASFGWFCVSRALVELAKTVARRTDRAAMTPNDKHQRQPEGRESC